MGRLKLVLTFAVWRWAVLALLLTACAAGAIRLARTTWHLRTSGPVTGSFAAGPINQYFSAGQTMQILADPVARIDLKLGRHGDREPVAVLVEIRDGPAGRSLRSGQVSLAKGSAWYSLSFPAIGRAEAPSGELFLEVRSPANAPLADSDKVAVYYERGDRFAGGRMYTLGQPADSGQDIAIRIYRQVRLRQLLEPLQRRAPLGNAGPITALAAGAVLLAGCVGLLFCPIESKSALLWPAALAGLTGLAIALNWPEAAANPAIQTIAVGIS